MGEYQLKSELHEIIVAAETGKGGRSTYNGVDMAKLYTISSLKDTNICTKYINDSKPYPSIIGGNYSVAPDTFYPNNTHPLIARSIRCDILKILCFISL